jgi:hypothetical protein
MYSPIAQILTSFLEGFESLLSLNMMWHFAEIVSVYRRFAESGKDLFLADLPALFFY